MPSLAKYAFTADHLSPTEASELSQRILGLVTTWLQQKGVASPIAQTGSFRSRTRGNPDGSYQLQTLSQDGEQLTVLRLHEFTSAELLFETQLQVLSRPDAVEVFVTLSAQSTGSMVAPQIVSAKCPRIVREILQQWPAWSFNGQAAPNELIQATGEVDGIRLADAIQNASRVHPIVVICDLDGEELLPGLGEKLAYDLAGLAQVVSIDDDASWGLSSKVGKLNSCYLGAARLYWPKTGDSERLYSTVWTASKLLPTDESLDEQARDRFVGQVRQRVLAASAEAVVEPRPMTDFKARRARMISAATDETSRNDELEALRAANLEGEKALEEARQTIARLHQQLREAQESQAQPLAIPGDAGPPPLPTKPPSGDVRFYKKIHSKSNYDVLVPIADCGHTSWQNASKADKAKKGIVRLEGTAEWSQVQHCGTCTGGGVWRVKW
ncbi:hypothetical protein [Stenotrophomonas sp. NPDC077659]|uniref:hypothetical protein n=1 Tax=Stenotrophomonas sp. NPDC077659 TaxID=3390694 RepID=UPI003D0238AD